MSGNVRDGGDGGGGIDGLFISGVEGASEKAVRRRSLPEEVMLVVDDQAILGVGEGEAVDDVSSSPLLSEDDRTTIC